MLFFIASSGWIAGQISKTSFVGIYIVIRQKHLAIYRIIAPATNDIRHECKMYLQLSGNLTWLENLGNKKFKIYQESACLRGSEVIFSAVLKRQPGASMNLFEISIFRVLI